MAAPEDEDPRARVDREAIMARRRRWVAATLTGLTTSTLATACPCLKVAPAEPHGSPPAEDEQPHDDGDAAEQADPYEGGEPAEGQAEAEDDAAADAEADAGAEAEPS